jgi:broad specificity phosphatase PhoE
VCLTGRQIDPEKCPALREQFLGELECRTWEEAQAVYGKQIRNFVDDWFHTEIPQAETPGDMLMRVSRCAEEIINGGEDTLIVAHNGTLTLLLFYLGFIGEAELADMTFGFRFGCYSKIRIDAAGAVLEGHNI